MKATLNWLKEYVDIDLPAEEIARRLTMAGLEVEEITTPGVSWDNVLVGRIKAINPHPNADRLSLPTIDLGEEEVSVVCGAPNLEIGQKIAFARVGARLVDAHTGELATLKAAKIRGIASSGMVCSERELGISDSHEGVLVLPEDAPVGTALADYMGDVVLNIDITPNRPDCLSVIGIAREVAAQTGKTPHVKEGTYKETGPDIKGMIEIDIQAPDLCPRYAASLVTGITIKESPAWMQQRLTACGMRPINNIVDITNYIMLEYGQPLHSFDYDRIGEKKIIVRRASEGEKFTTLDDVERTLSKDTLVIADGKQSVAVAGVMGGANSEVTDSTSSILLEAASFNAASIHYTGRALGISSEACMRFERGISPGIVMPALKRATELLVELGDGQAATGIIDEYPGRKEPAQVPISVADVKRILGIDVTLRQMEDALSALGIESSRKGENALAAVAPYWRSDLRITEDLAEELARVIGYDSIPTTTLNQAIPHYPQKPVIGLRRKLATLMQGYGFQEIITFSLTSLDALRKLTPERKEIEPAPLKLKNPMSVEQEYMRPSLRANVLPVLASNLRHQDGSVRIFELGHIYKPRENDLPSEEDVLCAVIYGPQMPKSWQGESPRPDFYEAKGIIEAVLAGLGVMAVYEPGSDAGLHPSRQAEIKVEGTRIGLVGEIHPAVLANFEIEDRAFLLELDVEALLPFAQREHTYQQITRFPAIYRDQALVLDKDVRYQQVLDIIGKFSLVKQVNVFDVYSGDQVPAGKKSLAYRLTFQSADHTLTDREVDGVEKAILKRLRGELGASLRG